MKKYVCVTALVVSFSVSGWAAGDDDDLAPLAPIKKAPAKAPPPAKKAPPPPVRKQPAPVVKKGAGDDELVPLGPTVNKGDLAVRVNVAVSGALLSVDGKEIGALPLGPQTLSSGEHLVTVKRAGYAAFVKKVVIAAGKTLELEAKLTAVAAVISVSSDVNDAQVYLNGRLLGTAPITEYEVPPGTVELSVLKEGFREDKQKLSLVAGKDYPVVVKFGPVVSDRPVATSIEPTHVSDAPLAVTQAGPASTPIYQRWYFWVGAAAVVAAVAAGTAVGVSTANAPLGHFEPSQICSECSGTIGFPAR